MAMNCEEARDLLIDRLLDELDPEERRRLETHLSGCPDCRAAAREMSAVWEALGSLGPPPADPASLVRFGRRLERERPRTRLAWPLLAAAATALLVAGGLVGRALSTGRAGGATGTASPGGAPPPAAIGPEPTPVLPRFLLLLRGDEPDRRQPHERLIEEYGAWARRLAAAGALVSADELDPAGGRWVTPDAATDRTSEPIGGFFLVEAPSYDSAVAIARASPHAAYGGLIEVRRIVGAR